MSEERYEDREEPGDPLEEQERTAAQEQPDEGEPWAKTSSGDADDVTTD